MKQELLLEALGHIEEALLTEAPRRSFRGLWRAAVLAAVLVTLALTAGALGSRLFIPGSNTMSNTQTARGQFAYGDGYYYFGTASGLYRLREGSQRPERLNTEADPQYLFMTEQGLCYVTESGSFALRTPQGEETLDLPEGSHLTRVYGEGNLVYTNNGSEFCRIDLVSGERTVLLTDVHGYYVDENWIYALTEGAQFLRSPKDTAAFESISLTFHPASVTADGDTLYFTKFLSSGNRYRIIRYRDSEETPLPIVGFNPQILGEQLLYQDGTLLRLYDPATGSNTVIAEDVYEYAVLNGDCICISHYGGRITVGGKTVWLFSAG